MSNYLTVIMTTITIIKMPKTIKSETSKIQKKKCHTSEENKLYRSNMNKIIKEYGKPKT